MTDPRSPEKAEIAAIHEVAKILTSTQNLDRALGTALRTLRSFFGFDRAIHQGGGRADPVPAACGIVRYNNALERFAEKTAISTLRRREFRPYEMVGMR